MIELNKSDSWFNELYEKHKKQLIEVAYFLLNDKSTAEDLSHEAYLVLYAKRDEVVNHPDIRRFLVKCVRNLSMNWLKRAENRLVDPLTPEHEVFLGVEDRERMEDMLPLTMSETDRKLVLLHLDQGLTYEEVGRILGISARACEGRMYRLKNQFRKKFDKDTWGF